MAMRPLDPIKFRAAAFDQDLSEETGYSNYSYWRSTFRTFFKSWSVRILVALVGAILIMSFLYPIFSDVDPTKVSLFPWEWNKRPSAEHWFGTDALGRDIFARAWYGARNSFLLGFCIALSDVGFGILAGSLWGYNKKLDPFMIELYNLMTNIPSTVYLMLLAYIMNTSYITLFRKHILIFCLFRILIFSVFWRKIFFCRCYSQFIWWLE